MEPMDGGLVPSASDGLVPSDSNSELATVARQGLRLLFQDPAAVEKSKEQLEYIMACVKCEPDIQAILPTGGGKSAGWLVPAMLDPQRVSVIVTPYTLALEDQLRVARGKGIVAEQFTAARAGHPQLHQGVQLIFVQPETVAHDAFRT
jgi:superfamily II DNA helicase RecQ